MCDWTGSREASASKKELLNLRLSELPIAKVLYKLEFDTEDQVLYDVLFLNFVYSIFMILSYTS